MKTIATFLILLFFYLNTIAQTASITGSTEVCQSSQSPQITFTGSGGLAPYTFYYNIDGGNTLSVISTGNTATIDCPTTSSGNFIYNLLSVTDANSSSQALVESASILVNPLPTSTLSGTTTVCVGASEPVITFTGANGTPPYTFHYNINNGNTQTVTSIGANSTATITMPTAFPGVFTCNLIGIEESSNTQCYQGQTGSEVVTVESCADLTEDEMFNIKLYPIPTEIELNISSEEIITSFQICDLNGKIINLKEPNQKNFKINLSDLNDGIYYIKINSSSKSTIKKIVKKI